jgi:hypothetical protein
VEFLALIVASLTLPAIAGAVVLGALGYLQWGWIGALIGVLLGYVAGVWYEARFAGVPLSPHAKGWLSLAMFIGGIAVLAIATR